jgi:hypothetical protein
MPVWFNILVQVVGTLGQILNFTTSFLPEKYRLLLTAVLGAMQAGVGAFAHYYNPDGTSATTPYVAK